MFLKKLDSIIKTMPNDNYELIWKDTISHSFLKFDQDDNPIVLKASMFLSDASILGVFDLNGPNNIRQPSPGETFDAPLLVYHNKESGDNILLKATDIQYMTSEYSIGYKNPLSGKVIENVILNTRAGFMLEGRVGFDDSGRLIDRGDNWFEPYLDNDLYFSEQDGAFTLRNCYRYIAFITGENVMPFLQGAVYNFIGTEAYEPYFASETTKLSTKFEDSFVFTPIVSGKLITPDTFFKTYLNLIDLRYVLATEKGTSTKPSYANTYIADKIGLFNVRFTPSTGRIDMSSLRSKSDFEGIINKLFVTKNDILNFLFLKEYNGEIIPMSKTDLTIKEWFHMLFEKIANYQGNLGTDRVSELIKEAKTSFTNKYSENPFDISADKKEAFSPEEVKAGKIAFEVVSRLFGHFTLRLLFMHMIDFYGNPKSYKIDILNLPSHREIAMYLTQFSIVTSTQRYITTPVSNRVAVKNLLFSLFFLNSHMVLPVERNNDNKDATVYFGYSPISFMDDSFISTSLKSFDSEIETHFRSLYKNYLDNTYGGSATDRRIKLFIDSGLEMIKTLKVVLRTKLGTLGLEKEEQIELYNRLLIAAEKEILDYNEEYISHGNFRLFNLRFQIENLLIGRKFIEKITFHQVEFKGKSFELDLGKDIFSGKDIKIFRSFSYNYLDFDFQGHNYGIIKEKTQILKKTIESAVGKDGRVRIYPLYKPSQVEGYHFLLSPTFFKDLIPTERLQIPDTKKKDARFFDVDLQDIDIQIKLEHIVKLSLSYIDSTKDASFPRDFLFVITKDDLGGKAVYDYDKMIGAFDRNRFYNPNEIYSIDQGVRGKYEPFKISNFESGIKIDPDLIEQWVKANKFLTLATKYNFPKNYITWW
jgi:hypothetical protein